MRRLALILTLLAGPAAAHDVAITFDDLPAHATLPPGVTRAEVTRKILAALRAAKSPPAYGFVNGVQLEREPDSAAALVLWRKARQPLANHTFSHPNLNAVGAQAFIADIDRNAPVLKARGGDWRWFRYPFLAEGEGMDRALVRRHLSERGYRIASVTLSFDDWAFNDPYARCMAKGDDAAIADLEARYLAWARASFAHSRNLALMVDSRDVPPLVLLLHAGAFDARMLPRLLEQYRRDGVRFVPLEAAMRHPFYADDYGVRATDVPVTLEARAEAAGHVVPEKPWHPAVLDGVCR